MKSFSAVSFPAVRWLREGTEAVLALFFPGECEVCGRALVRGERYLCTACLADFPFADDVFDGNRALAERFEGAERPPENLYTLFYYNRYGDYKNLIYSVKYYANRRLGFYLGRMLGERLLGKCTADCLVPVPLHPRRERERGFNQALEIARGINSVLGIEICDRAIIRIRNNDSQTGKTTAGRHENVHGIFALHQPWQVAGRHVLLVDDVITTGATVGSCMQVLAAAGEVRFSLACLARVI